LSDQHDAVLRAADVRKVTPAVRPRSNLFDDDETKEDGVSKREHYQLQEQALRIQCRQACKQPQRRDALLATTSLILERQEGHFDSGGLVNDCKLLCPFASMIAETVFLCDPRKRSKGFGSLTLGSRIIWYWG